MLLLVLQVSSLICAHGRKKEKKETNNFFDLVSVSVQEEGHGGVVQQYRL